MTQEDKDPTMQCSEYILHRTGFTNFMFSISPINKHLAIECANKLNIPIKFGIIEYKHLPVFTTQHVTKEQISALRDLYVATLGTEDYIPTLRASDCNDDITKLFEE